MRANSQCTVVPRRPVVLHFIESTPVLVGLHLGAREQVKVVQSVKKHMYCWLTEAWGTRYVPGSVVHFEAIHHTSEYITAEY